jgi:ribonuclease HI
MMATRSRSSRGGDLFAESTPGPAAKQPTTVYRANIDGGSRGNPGPAAYGVVIVDPKGHVTAKLKKYIGRTTNNVAEYYALIAALDYAGAHGIRDLKIESDSELLVNQMRGRYKVKSAELKPLFERARKTAQGLETFRIEHVYREQNRDADTLVNEALDETSGGPRPAPRAAKPDPAAKLAPRKILARFRSGILYPLQDVDLEDGAEVEIVITNTLKINDK